MTRIPQSPFGALTFLDWNHDWNHFMYDTPEKVSRTVELIAAAGIGMVRQILSWDEVQTHCDEFHFDRYDRIVDELEKRDIQLLGLLGYTALCTGKKWNEAPDEALFVEYVRNTVRHFKSRIHYWEIWNEPDHQVYWKDQDSMKTYTSLLKKTYAAIKQEDPTALVLTGSVSSAEALANMYRFGAKDSFDIMNIHPFTSPLFPDALQRIKSLYTSICDVMRVHENTNKPIWFTETGCPGVRNGTTSRGWWEGKSPTEDEQAKWLETLFSEGLRWPGVEKIFWAFMQDANHFGDDTDTFGLIREDFTPKPSYYSYQRAIQSWRSQALHS